MKIFIDFDDVIFDTKRFKKDYKQIFADHGVSEEFFDKYYYTLGEKRQDGKLKEYNLQRHLEGIKKGLAGDCEVDIGNLKRGVMNFLEDLPEYLFSEDLMCFLEKYSKENLYIISYGDPDFLKLKINGTGITKYFQDVLMTNQPKSEALAGVIIRDKIDIENEKIYFLDDRAHNLTDIKNKFPEITTILVKREDGRYKDESSESCDFEVKDLRKVTEKIENLENAEIRQLSKLQIH